MFWRKTRNRNLFGKQSRWLLVLSFYLLAKRPASAAEITGLTPLDLKVTRGDQLTLRVATVGEQPAIEWWSEGRIICKSDSCAVDTSSFSPGKTVLDLIVQDKAGIAFSQIYVSANDAPPLYTPKILTPDVLAPEVKPVTVARGQWLIIERDGGVSYTNPARPKEIIQASLYSAPSAEFIYHRLPIERKAEA